MSQWETIRDRSSHISPARLSSPKNHSTKRGKDIFDGKFCPFFFLSIFLYFVHQLKKVK